MQHPPEKRQPPRRARSVTGISVGETSRFYRKNLCWGAAVVHRHAAWFAALGLVLLVLAVPPALAENIRRIEIGVGHGPQWVDGTIEQNNSIIDLNFFFKEYPIPKLGASTILFGMGYSYLWTNTDRDRENHVFSLIPAYRYYFKKLENFQMFIHIAAGPSLMTSYNLGYQEQGSKFIFNDSAGLGVRFSKKNQWELSLLWRHLSNAGLASPNHGYDVPFTFVIGRVF